MENYETHCDEDQGEMDVIVEEKKKMKERKNLRKMRKLKLLYSVVT